MCVIYYVINWRNVNDFNDRAVQIWNSFVMSVCMCKKHQCELNEVILKFKKLKEQKIHSTLISK